MKKPASRTLVAPQAMFDRSRVSSTSARSTVMTIGAVEAALTHVPATSAVRSSCTRSPARAVRLPAGRGRRGRQACTARGVFDPATGKEPARFRWRAVDRVSSPRRWSTDRARGLRRRRVSPPPCSGPVGLTASRPRSRTGSSTSASPSSTRLHPPPDMAMGGLQPGRLHLRDVPQPRVRSGPHGCRSAPAAGDVRTRPGGSDRARRRQSHNGMWDLALPAASSRVSAGCCASRCDAPGPSSCCTSPSTSAPTARPRCGSRAAGVRRRHRSRRPHWWRSTFCVVTSPATC